MKNVFFPVSAITLSIFPFAGVAEENIPAEQRPCIEMLEGWYEVDASRLDQLLHTNFIKQGVLKSPSSGETVTTSHNKQQFIEAVGSPREKLPESDWAIVAETLHLSDNLATVKVTSLNLVDVCQLGKIGENWQIMNVIWTSR